jgi:hypothetical protein
MIPALAASFNIYHSSFQTSSMSHVCTKEVILSLIDDVELIAREMLGNQLLHVLK